MAKGTSKSAGRTLECPEDAGEHRRPELALYRAERRVREIQTKLHRLRDGACGAPAARKRARRVREAARGNPPVETPAGRPGSTSLRPRGLPLGVAGQRRASA